MWNIFKKPNIEETRTVGGTSGGMVQLFNNGFLSNKRVPTSIATAYRCISLISATVGDTALEVVETESNDDIANAPSLRNLIRNPNPYQTYSQFMTNLVQDVVTQGNGYIWIQGNNLWHLPSDAVSMYMTTDYQHPYYYQVSYFGKSFKVFADEMIHVRNPLATSPSTGYLGLSPLTAHKLTFDNALGMEEYLKDYYDNAAQIAGTLETPNKLQPQVIQDMIDGFKKQFTGKNNRGKAPVLVEGLKFNQLTPLSPVDADYIKAKQLTDLDICNIFGVPNSLLGAEVKFSGGQNDLKTFETLTLSPLMNAISQEFTKKLIPLYAQAKRSFSFHKDQFRYSSSDEVAQSVSLLVNSSIFTINEARAKYNLPTIAGGDELLVAKEEKAAKEAEKAKQLQANKQAKDSAPKTASTVKGNNPVNSNRSLEELEKEIHKLKTENGRLKK